MEEKEDSFFEEVGKIFLIVLIIGSIFEVGLLVFAYVNADEVECNWLWCTFIIHNSYSNITQSITSSSQCYINGEHIDCSEMEDYKNTWRTALP